jgi:hypothetical protein
VPAQSNKEQAVLAAENLGIEFGPIDAHKTREVIELLDDDDKDILNNFIQDDIAIKIERQNSENVRMIVEEEDEKKETEPISDRTRKSSRAKVPNRKYVDYKLYITAAEEDEFLLATNGGEPDKMGAINTEMGDERLSAVAHYIMVHYAEKELIKKHKKKYKPKDGRYTLDAGLRNWEMKARRLPRRSSVSSTLIMFLNRWLQRASAKQRKKAHYHCSYSLKKRETEQ